MHVGFLGGSFDPPHRGHLAAAHAALRTLGLDYVLFAPAGAQPLKKEGAVASYADRLAMVRLCCKDTPQFEASTLDAPRPFGRPNYTVDALKVLRRTLGSADTIYVLVGADAFLDLRRWRDPERLLAAAEWIVLGRPGFELGDLETLRLTAQQKKRVHVLDKLCDPASATDVRALLAAGKVDGPECAELVPASVLAYIRKHHLYGT